MVTIFLAWTLISIIHCYKASWPLFPVWKNWVEGARLYLIQRHQTWWALHDVPVPLRKTLGRRLSRSLKTHDKGTATRLAAVLWAHEWSRLVGGASSMKAEEAEAHFYADRSEERRVGKECLSVCRSRWSPYH